MYSSESLEHKKIKNLISARLREWTGASLEEYPSSGHELDVFAVTPDRISIYIEIVWSATSRNFYRDMNMIQQSDADVKLVVVSPGILSKEDYVREFSKIAISQRRMGKAMHGEMIDGRKILEDEKYLDTEFKDIVLSLVNKCAPSKTPISKTKYPEIPHYLPRRVCSTKDYGSINMFLLRSELSQDILPFIEQNNRIVLLSDAGVGKTTELQQIAWHFSKDDSPFYPFFFSLNKYVNQRLSELLPPHWNEIPESQPLIILDGLDEIESKNKNDAIRQIELFSEQYPKSKVIVSCRTNFYKSETKQSSGTLGGFSSYVLLDLDDTEIEKYIETKLGKQAHASFKQIIFDNQLQDLLKIPFYLTRLVELFEANNALPRSKAEIFEQLLIARIKLDVEHFRTTIELDEKQKTIIETLERLALGMEVLGRNYITDDEYQELIPDESLRTLIKHCTVWTKTEGDTVTWQFEHKNFQEYLAARVLSRQSFQMVKQFVSFEPDYQKVIPSWVNTLSFLLSISNDRALFAWILENEPMLIAEPDKIETNTRIRIFKEIFNNYKAKQIWIPRDKFRYSELTRFGQSKEIIDFLLTELETATHYTILCNAIELLGYLEISTNLRQHVGQLLVKFSLDGKKGEMVQNRALIALASLDLNSQKVVEQIVPALRSSNSDWVRYGLYYFLHTSDYLDENIEVFLEGIEHVRSHPSIESRETRLSDEHWHLKIGLEKAKSPEAIIKIFTYFREHPKDLDDVFFEKSISIIAENAADSYPKEPLLFESAMNLFTTLVSTYLEKQARQFLCFFDKTNTRLQAFQSAFEQTSDNKHYLVTLATLADMKCIEFFVQQYEKGKITDRDVWAFQNYLGWKNHDLYLPFNELINKKSGDKFVLPPKRDFDKERKERRQRDIDLLFDKQAFLNELKLIFDTEQKQTFTSKELLNVQTHRWDNPYFSDLAIHTLHNIAKNRTVSLKTATRLVNSWDWDFFCVSKIYEYFRRDKQLTLSTEQKDWIANWCYSNLNKVNFKTALIQKSNSSFSTSRSAIFLWFFLRRLNLTYPKNVLLDMLSFDWVEESRMLGIGYLEKRLNKVNVTARMLENLQEGIENNDVLKNHIDYCRRNKIKEVLPYALREINNAIRNYEVRHVALETICEMSETLSDLEQILPKITDDFKWNVVEQLVKRNSKYAHKFLLDTLSNDNEQEQLKAAEYLIRLQDYACMQGLKYYVEWIKRHKQLPERSFDRSPLLSLQALESVPYLIKMLGISYQDDFVQSDFQRLDSIVFNTLTAIALQSDQHYITIKEAIENFIKEYSPIMRNVNFLYSFLERLEQRYYIAKSEKLDINDVTRKLDKIYARGTQLEKISKKDGQNRRKA